MHHFRLTLQLSTEVKNGVTDLFQAAKLLQPELRDRSALGVVLQHPSVRPWERSIVWAAVMAILPHWTLSGWNADCQAVLQQFVDLQQYIRESGLAADIDRPPLLNVSRRQATALINRVTSCNKFSTFDRRP